MHLVHLCTYVHIVGEKVQKIIFYYYNMRKFIRDVIQKLEQCNVIQTKMHQCVCVRVCVVTRVCTYLWLCGHITLPSIFMKLVHYMNNSDGCFIILMAQKVYRCDQNNLFVLLMQLLSSYQASPWSTGSAVGNRSLAPRFKPSLCFIFNISSLLVEVAQPIQPTVCTNVTVKHSIYIFISMFGYQ